MSAAAQSTPRTFAVMKTAPRLLCLKCARPLAREEAVFHRLRCKTRLKTGAVDNGERRKPYELY